MVQDNRSDDISQAEGDFEEIGGVGQPEERLSMPNMYYEDVFMEGGDVSSDDSEDDSGEE